MTPSDAVSGPAGGYSQQDYWQQPFRQDDGGQAPQRPAGWSDPYGQRSPENGQAEQGAEQARQAPAAAPARYPDLPDGRPQYGLRHSDVQAQGAQAQSDQAQGGQGGTVGEGPEGTRQGQGDGSVDGRGGDTARQ
jgi:hypothetical protein